MTSRKASTARGATRSPTRPTRPLAPAAGLVDYTDFVLVARRSSPRTVSVTVASSLAGNLNRPVAVPFSAKEAAELRASFVASFGQGAPSSGGMLITQERATEIGKRLARVLFPPKVFKLFAESLALAVEQPHRGLRLRLALDESLLDLPWEYVYRPDRLRQGGLSGFLLLDPSISMVRHAADPAIQIQPITGRQRLAFIGTFWEGKKDGWSVWKEFSMLRDALKGVSRYIRPEFAAASTATAFKAKHSAHAAIFHYAGHCDFDRDGRAYLIRELPTSRPFTSGHAVYLETLAPQLAKNGTRLAVLSACNSGYWTAVKPLINEGIPAVLGINGGVNSESTIQFCTKLYESIALGLTLDEAVNRARLHVMEWGRALDLFDWGLFMVHMPSPDATLFPQASTRAVTSRRASVRQDHAQTIDSTMRFARQMDGMNFGQIMSELSKRRVLILGRFTGRRLSVLKGLQAHLEQHANQYVPELFTYHKPDSRDLVESIVGFAALSRFVIADLSEPKSIQSELEAIVPHFQSVPIVPVINQSGREYATFSSIQRRVNVVKPTVRYRNLADLLTKVDEQLVPLAEKTLEVVRPRVSGT